MLLQKTSWRIKHIITPKKSSSTEKPGKLSDDGRKTKPPISAPKRLSWLSQTSSSDSPPLRRAISDATTRSRRLTQSESTAHSSSSSLCSCECEANPAPIDHSLFGVEPPPPLPEILYLPPLSSEDASQDAKTWRLIFQEPLSYASSPDEPRIGTIVSSIHTLGTVSAFDDIVNNSPAHLIDDDKTPTQSLKCTGESEIEDLPENVDQLIRETDRAFQAVGTGLADVKAVRSGLFEPFRPVPPRPISISRGMTKGPSRLPSRSLSFSKGRKRFVKKRTNMFSRSIPKSPPPPANTPARWTLTDVTANMVDVFGGKIFRTEVDEMLTPGRIQQMRNEKAESARKISVESIRSFETDESTPTDPFHLESLSFRITAAQQKLLPFSSPVMPPPATPQASPRDSMRTPPPRPPRPEDCLDLPSSRAGMVFNNLSFPAPPIPPRAPRWPSASRRASLLPTILEVSPLNPTPAQFASSHSNLSDGSSWPSLTIFPPSTQTFLPSTNFTLTAPLFRHGPIRVDRLLRERKGSSPEEEALDWIAFQMAIAGTMELDEHFCDLRDDTQWESDEAEIDDVLEWWKSFGFDGHGRMESEADVRKKDGLAPLSSPATISTQQMNPGKEEILKDDSDYLQKRTWKTWTDTPPRPVPPARVYNTGPRVTGRKPTGDATDASRTAPPPPYQPLISSLAIAAATTRRSSLAESVLSLPPSPMLDLVVSTDPGADDEETIPMGFNLGYDLGDFLNWEARHMQSLYSEK